MGRAYFVSMLLATLSLVACSSKNSGAPGDRDASSDAGGAPMTAGGHGGTPSNGGTGTSTGGQGGSTSSGGTTSTTPDAGRDSGHVDGGSVCERPPGPFTNADVPRRMLPWNVKFNAADTVPTIGGNDAGPDVQPDAGTFSGCWHWKTRQQNDEARCRGLGRVHRTSTDLELDLADGASLRWAPDLAAVHVAPPALQDGEDVAVDYTHEMGIACSYCGGFSNEKLVLREPASRRILWIGRQGHTLPDLDAALIQQLFGTTARVELACTESHGRFDGSDPRLFSGCFDTLRSVFNHVLATTPEQVVVHGALEHVTTPGGVYDVVWTHTTDVITWNPSCADGPTPVNDNAFAASRTVR